MMEFEENLLKMLARFHIVLPTDQQEAKHHPKPDAYALRNYTSGSKVITSKLFLGA